MKTKIIALLLTLTISVQAGTTRNIYTDNVKSETGTGTLTLNTSGTLTAPNATDTLVGKATTDTFSNKSMSGASNTFTSIPNSATTATNANTASTIVARDGSGNFLAGTITGTLSGNASTATAPAAGTSHGAVVLNSSGNFSSVAPGTLNNILTSNGTDWVSSAPATSGTVTSVAISVPSGLTVSGSPITSSGTLAITASGQFAASQMPAFTGDITTSAGAVATTAAATQANITTLSNSSGVSLHGTNTNNNASAGYLGEYIESVVSTPTNFGTSGQYFDTTSVSLTAGDWDVSYLMNVTANGATMSTGYRGGVWQTTGNSTTGMVVGSNTLDTIGANGSYNASISIPMFRVSLSGTTTYYGKGIATYSAATPQFTCRLSARRVR